MKKLILIIGFTSILAGCSFNHQINKDEKAENQTEKQVSESKNKGENSDGTLTLDKSYFNEIVEVNGKKVIQNPTNIMILVNKEFGLPKNYKPERLVRPKVDFSFGKQDIEKSYLRSEAATALEKMFADAEQNGVKLYGVSGFRSFERQQNVFDAQVNQVGEENAIKVVSVPGNSEHQTGLSMDISCESADFLLTEKFGELPEGKWLVENAHRFGFILRYPKGKESITGYNYEPWHFRYVGLKAASEIYKHKLTLEEYINTVKKI